MTRYFTCMYVHLVLHKTGVNAHSQWAALLRSLKELFTAGSHDLSSTGYNCESRAAMTTTA